MKVFWQICFVPVYLVSIVLPVFFLRQADQFFLPLTLLGLLGTTLIERYIPFATDWNFPKADLSRDIVHAALNYVVVIIFMVSVITARHRGLLPELAIWPTRLPIAAQVLLAIIVSDGLMTGVHYLSHHSNWLWRLHSVHHSVERVYALNGLMKHPLHQLIGSSVGFLPLYIAGIPDPVAMLAGHVSVSLFFLAHANADFRLGALNYIFAFAPVHRYHHLRRRRQAKNYGITLIIWDHLCGTFMSKSATNDLELTALGPEHESGYPRGFFDQLVVPFRWRW